MKICFDSGTLITYKVGRTTSFNTEDAVPNASLSTKILTLDVNDSDSKEYRNNNVVTRVNAGNVNTINGRYYFFRKFRFL